MCVGGGRSGAAACRRDQISPDSALVPLIGRHREGAVPALKESGHHVRLHPEVGMPDVVVVTNQLLGKGGRAAVPAHPAKGVSQVDPAGDRPDKPVAVGKLPHDVAPHATGVNKHPHGIVAAVVAVPQRRGLTLRLNQLGPGAEPGALRHDEDRSTGRGGKRGVDLPHVPFELRHNITPDSRDYDIIVYHF